MIFLIVRIGVNNLNLITKIQIISLKIIIKFSTLTQIDDNNLVIDNWVQF